jgi:transcriptional accessory protein Tex/SPT6
VHQDGLIHISALSDTFVKDPRDVVKAGDIVKVKVLEVDVARKRIALTRRLDDTPGQPPAARASAMSGPGQGRAVTLAARTVGRTGARALAAVRPSPRRRPTMPWPRPSPAPSAVEDRAPVTLDPGRGTCRFSL